jgi:hypothetical protein
MYLEKDKDKHFFIKIKKIPFLNKSIIFFFIIILSGFVLPVEKIHIQYKII